MYITQYLKNSMNYAYYGPEDIIKKWCKKNKPSSLLNLSCWTFDSLPELPDTVEYLDISQTSIKRIEKLPKSLKWLKCNSSDIEEFPETLPPNLKYINCYNCEHLKVFSVSKGVKIIESFKEYLTEKELKEISHEELAKKRINEWNKKKNSNIELDLSLLKLNTLPEIPNGVEQLNCGGMLLTSLKALPPNLKRLDCSGFLGKEFDYLPNGLEYLKCNGSSIEIIDNLPNSLKKLEIGYYTPIKIINKLPPNLRHLDLNYADVLEEINCPFPETLRCIILTMTRVKHLPRLPDSVKKFNIFMDYSIKYIPNLPNKLKVLGINSNRIKSLPPLPEGLLRLYVNSLSLLDNNILPNSICILKSNEIELEASNFR